MPCCTRGSLSKYILDFLHSSSRYVQEGLNQLTDEPWVNMRPLFEKLTTQQLQEFLALHQEPPSRDSTSSQGLSGSSLSQYQSEQKRVKPNDDIATDEPYTRTALMAKISSCRCVTVILTQWSNVQTRQTMLEICNIYCFRTMNGTLFCVRHYLSCQFRIDAMPCLLHFMKYVQTGT